MISKQDSALSGNTLVSSPLDISNWTLVTIQNLFTFLGQKLLGI